MDQPTKINADPCGPGLAKQVPIVPNFVKSHLGGTQWRDGDMGGGVLYLVPVWILENVNIKPLGKGTIQVSLQYRLPRLGNSEENTVPR